VIKPDLGTVAEFLAYDEGMVYGFELAAGDFDGDGAAELVTAAGIGTNGHVRLFGIVGAPKFLASGFFPFGQDSRAGAFLATGDLDGDGIDELLVGSGPGAEPRAQLWGFDGRGYLGEFAPLPQDSRTGVSLAAGDLDSDGRDEILAAPAYGGDGRVLALDGLTYAPVSTFAPQGPDYEGSLLLSFADGLLRTVARPGGLDSRPWLPQFVRVSLDGQRLHAYEYGDEAFTFLISSGRYGFDTPPGEYAALAKPEWVYYSWTYGEDNPENYDLGLVQWNVRFRPHYYIHNAPWHNNFGRRMSHGCVNASPSTAELIWNWIEVGTPISIS
jgi:lipoprotein-anchoring transpeptidase ErfK/SrfK